jgi:LuxR family transcriptional activator of bioluminescence operon
MIDLNVIFERISEVKTTDAFKNLCIEICEDLEVDYFLFAVISTSSLYAPSVKMVTNYPSEWIDDYVVKGHQNNDPVVKYVMFNQMPIIWSKLMLIEEYNNYTLMQEAAGHGLQNGLTVPIHGLTGDINIFSVVMDDEPLESEKFLTSIMPAVQMIAMKLVDVYTQINISTMKQVKFTKREGECLKGACEGKTAWEISQIIDISERTVLFHINNTVKKLNATNRQHAVAIALKNNLVQADLNQLSDLK